MYDFIGTHPVLFSPLFFIAVIALGLAIVWVVQTSPVAPSFQSAAGIVAPFGNVTAVLFALIVAFTGQDIWQRHSKAELAVAQEADAIRVIRGVVHGLGERGAELNGLVARYATASAANDWRSPRQREAANAALGQMLDYGLFGALTQTSAQVQQTVLSAIGDIRASRRDRQTVSHYFSTQLKWAGAFLLGVLTQLGVALSHLGKPRAARLAVSVFSICMSIVLWTTFVRLDVFSGVYAISLDPIVTAAGAAR